MQMEESGMNTNNRSIGVAEMRTSKILVISGLWLALSIPVMGCQPSTDCSSDACGPCGDTACEVSVPAAVEKAAAVQEVKINTSVLERLLRSSVKVVILDARTGKYDDGTRIPGAQSLSPSATEEEASKIIASKKDLVVTYCSNLKCQASHKLAGRLRELGYVNVLEYPEGIAGWKEAGNNVTTVQ